MSTGHPAILEAPNKLMKLDLQLFMVGMKVGLCRRKNGWEAFCSGPGGGTLTGYGARPWTAVEHLYNLVNRAGDNRRG